MPAKKSWVFLFLLIGFSAFFFGLPKKVFASPSCSLVILSPHPQVPLEYVDVWAGNFTGTVGNYEVYFRLAGSDPNLSPRRQDWFPQSSAYAGDIFCLPTPYNKSPDRCAAGAYYSQTGEFLFEVAVKDETGFHICGSKIIDICDRVKIPPDDFDYLYYADPASPNSRSNVTLKTLSYNNRWICGLDTGIGWMSSWGGYSESENTAPPAQGTINFLPNDFGYKFDSRKTSFSGIFCIGPSFYCKWVGDEFPRYDVREWFPNGTKELSFSLTDILINSYPDPKFYFGAFFNDTYLYYRDSWSGEGSEMGCQPQSACAAVYYKKEGGDWSPENFTILPGEQVELKCGNLVGPVDKWNWAAWLPSEVKNSYEGYSAITTHLDSKYDLTDQASRWESFVPPSAPVENTSWLVDKVVTKVSWYLTPNHRYETNSFYAQVFNSEGNPLWEDKYGFSFDKWSMGEGKLITFDIGYADLEEKEVLPGGNYKLALRMDWWDPNVGYWWNSTYPNYTNYYQLYLRPNIQGTFNPPDKNNQTVSWTAPPGYQVSPGQVFRIISHPHNSVCDWGWGDDILATIGDFGNLLVEYHLNTLDGNLVNCQSGFGAFVDNSKTMTCLNSGSLSGKLFLSLPPNKSYNIKPIIASGYRFLEWSYQSSPPSSNKEISVLMGGGGNNYVLKIAVALRSDPWFQGQEGDIHSRGDIYSPLPAGNNFSLDGESGFPGLVSYGGSADFGLGEVSSKKWLANSSSKGKDYDYFYQLLGQPTESNFSGNLSEISNDGVYYSAGDVKIDSNWSFPNNRKAVILINGKLTINGKIIVPIGSFLAFIVKGDIEIGGKVGEAVGQAGENSPDIEGVYISDGKINTNYDKDESGIRLVAAGIFVANDFLLGRNLENSGNTVPAEKFIYRPDFLINSYPGIWGRTILWSELAP